jgi:hypothetical protein
MFLISWRTPWRNKLAHDAILSVALCMNGNVENWKQPRRQSKKPTPGGRDCAQRIRHVQPTVKQQNQRQYARTKSKERHGQTAQQRKEGHSSTRQGRTQAERGTRSAEPTRAQLYQQAVRRQIANEQGRTGTSTTPIERELRSPRHAAALRLKYQWVTDAESALSNDAGLAGRMWLLRLRAEKDLSEPPPAPPRVHDL